MSRLSSRSFIIPFVLVTALFTIDVIVLAFFAPRFPYLETNPVFSYGVILTTYTFCVIEALGISVFSGFIKRMFGRRS
jgi:hypothetical protein